MIMSKFGKVSIILKILLVLHFICGQNATHITGTFRPNDFFKLLVKFGFQKTERHSQRDSFGYIYGNITSQDSYPVPITLAVLDKYDFLPYYGNRTLYDLDKACERMFTTIDHFAYDKHCHSKNTDDFLRRIPCQPGQLCDDEDAQDNVVPGYQFTYVISNMNQPRFWYISLVACYRNTTTCTWHHFDASKFHAHDGTKSNSKFNDFAINYDIHLVNGNPNQSSSNPLAFQFSFDQQNILEMNLIFFFVYLILVPMQIYAVRIQKHPVTKLFTLSLILEFVSLVFILSYYIRYAASGVGNESIKTTGDILDILSRTTFMLILLLLAKGWAVTRQQVTKPGWILLMSIWIPYCAFHVVLYVWNRTEVDVISDIDEYQTWPGWLVLASRSSIMLWFLWELRNTMKYEHSTRKLDFLLHFGASSLVWFIYLPVVAIVALQVNALWRYKLLLGITNSADCLGYCVMTGLLWPNRAGQYLLLASTNYSGMDELDEFNEAPHSLRSESSNIRHLPPDDDDDDDDDDNQSQNINILDRTNPGRIETPGRLISTDLLEGSEHDIVLSTDDLLIDANNHNTMHRNSFNQFALINGGQRQLQQQHRYQNDSLIGEDDDEEDDSVSNSQSVANENVNNWLNHSNSDSDVTIITNHKPIGNNKNSHIA